MTRRRSFVVAVTAVLLAAAAWSGFNAATADNGGDTQGSAARASLMHRMSLPTARSPAQARQLAAKEGLSGQTLTFVTHVISGRDAFVEVAPEDDVSTGDLFVQEAAVYTANHSQRIGTAVLHCEVGITTLTCNHTIWLWARGKILLSNTLFFPGNLVAAVTGGTGDFRDVGGQGMWFEGTVHPDRDMLFVVKLVR